MTKAKENVEKNLLNAEELFASYLHNIFANPGKDWQEKKLGDVCEIIAGQSPEGKFYNKEGKGTPFYQGKKEFTEKFIGNPVTWTTHITKIAQKDDILMSVRAPVGPINFSTQKICIGRGLASIRAKNVIDKNFLFSFLKFNEPKLIENKGAIFNSINKTQIQHILISIPPLSQQKAIVAKLDSLSTKTKQLEANYKNTLTNLDELKKSILKDAFNGEL